MGSTAAAPPDEESAFTLDPDLLARRKTATARRMNTVLIPALRALGFVVLSLVVVLNDRGAGEPFPQPALLQLVVLNLVYALAAGAALRWAHGRTGRLDVGLVLFHVDLLVWLVNLRYLEHTQLLFAYLLLVRVADQVGFGFRRALYFGAVVVAAYLGYSTWVWVTDAGDARWPERLAIAASMALIGPYLAFTGTVTERMRNRMREAIRAARGLVDSLEQKKQVLELQAAELNLARRDAEQASVAKSRFLATVSHELRTPMNGVLGTTELLLDTPLTPSQRQYAQTAYRSATALLALIDDVLDLSRLDVGQLVLMPTTVDLPALAAGTVELMEMAARDKPVELQTRIGPRVPEHVHADPVRLRQLLMNLLHNAVKFTERGSVVLDVSLLERHAELARLRFAVRDTGIGIASDQLDSIFDAFTQADTSRTRRHGGSGIGLALVKNLAQAMGGQLGVQSEVGAGSTFWVDLELPLAIVEPQPIEPEPAGDAELGARVLLAEDDPVNQLVIEQMLLKLGCVVDAASDGNAARDAAVVRRYDIVLMDLHMPGIDGYEATRCIRAHEQARRGARTPIVALTADALASARTRCIEAGMDDFVTKPVTMAALAAAIERWTGRRVASVSKW